MTLAKSFSSFRWKIFPLLKSIFSTIQVTELWENHSIKENILFYTIQVTKQWKMVSSSKIFCSSQFKVTKSSKNNFIKEKTLLSQLKLKQMISQRKIFYWEKIFPISNQKNPSIKVISAGTVNRYVCWRLRGSRYPVPNLTRHHRHNSWKNTFTIIFCSHMMEIHLIKCTDFLFFKHTYIYISKNTK